MLRASAHEPRSGPPAPRTIAAWTSSLCRKAQRTNKRFAIEARTQASPLETATEGQPRRALAGAARPEAAPACPAESPGSHSLSIAQYRLGRQLRGAMPTSLRGDGNHHCTLRTLPCGGRRGDGGPERPAAEKTHPPPPNGYLLEPFEPLAPSCVVWGGRGPPPGGKDRPAP